MRRRQPAAVGPCGDFSALLSILNSGDNILVTDSAYAPTRKFCNDVLTRHGVSTTYYDPLIGAGIEALMQPNTRAVFTEAPGSLSFEMQDIPAIAEVAHSKNAIVLMDNTWASLIYFCARAWNTASISIQSGTKYIGGHSDLMLGAVSCNTRRHGRRCTRHGPDDGPLRRAGRHEPRLARPSHHGRALAQHQKSGLKAAHWLAQRPEILRVLHPALESDPGHAIWKRDFTGASGLFSVVFKPAPQAKVNAFLNALTLFGIGASWGGVREPRHPVRLRDHTLGDQMGTRRTTVRFPHRTGRYRRSDCGSGHADLRRFAKSQSVEQSPSPHALLGGNLQLAFAHARIAGYADK